MKNNLKFIFGAALLLSLASCSIPKDAVVKVTEALKPAITIVSIAKTETNANVDTYTITYSDGKTEKFTVINGIDGEKGDKGPIGEQGIQGETGIQGIQGLPGEDGKVPEITINEDGYWVVNGVSSNIIAKGDKGDKGETGDDGKSAYELYLEKYPDYKGDEKTWFDDLVNGRLGNQTYHTVTFDTQGGSAIESQKILHGEKVQPVTTIKEGYDFKCWTFEDERWSFVGQPVTSDMTLVANWTAIVK